MVKRYKYTIKGHVQGVGFRPFVYKIALRLNLSGYVKNTADGVEIDIEGLKINEFEENLKNHLPPLAKITTMSKSELKPHHTKKFKIIESKNIYSSTKTATILQDTAICTECILDIDSLGKYHKYFATNCTNCGARYSIIKTVPYDRKNTSMKPFLLCKSCKDEYTNPTNRRFHAQPTSCKSCGLTLSLTIDNHKTYEDIYLKTSELIKDGKIGAIKGVGGFHIVCSALDNETIQRLRIYKNRPTKPLAMMCKDIKMISSFAKLSKKEIEILKSKEAPIVILKKLKSLNVVAPNIDKIGCILPYNAFYYLLFKNLQQPMVVTSANLSGESIITNKEDILKKLPFIDFIVDYNRDILNAIDDSVVQIVNNKLSILRFARGYAPTEIKLPFKIDKKILALGANQKSTIALALENKIVLSPYIGDLNTIESINFFKKTVDSFKRFYDFEPDILLCDKHNLYESTKYAKQSKKEFMQIQHHLAHIYSVKAEFGLKGDYLGFSFDGTGVGDDGSLWGGEVFVGDERVYHFKPIKLLGGEKAIKESKRVALSLLFEKYTLDEVLTFKLPFNQSEIKILYQSWTKNLNAPLTSSLGRLFDGIASLANLVDVQSYEGEAGLLCEKAYKNQDGSFRYKIDDKIIDIEYDFFDKDIVTKFINTIVNIVVDIAKRENLDVILSGGVFQNKILLELICKRFEEDSIRYYYNQVLPINDSSISVGQIYKFLRV